MPRTRRSITKTTWDDPKDRVDTIELGGRQMRRCSAKLRGSSPPRRCRKPATRGKYVCVLHGGKSPGGPIVHGRYSMALGPLQAAYDAFAKREDVLSLEPGIAALDAWVQHQIELAGRGDGVEFRKIAEDLFGDVERALASKDVKAAQSALDRLGAHLKGGATELRTLARAMDTLSTRQHHTERAREIELRGDQVVNAKALVAFLGQIVDIIKQEVPRDADHVLKRLTAEVMVAGRRLGQRDVDSD